MSNDEIKKVLIRMMREVNIASLYSAGTQQAFVRGEEDIIFEDLNMDSLASMELCIAIELGLGVSIVPEQLSQLSTLDGLAHEIQRLLP
ncbi:acyl carrier protein [Pseudoalteromonas sp.]|uniref:acyl carrier protein n=1 Tax=Pseudoalteromonas sp. TaxID=53249 RepID=UPI0030018DA8